MAEARTNGNNISHSILSVRTINDKVFALRFEKGSHSFIPGQYLQIGVPGDAKKRAFSIYSAVTDTFFELVIKMVEGGEVSGPLHELKPGDAIEMEAPAGRFTLDDQLKHKHIIFIASGTGISPFHSIIKSNPKLNYTLIHGVRTKADLIEPEAYAPEKLITCTSRDTTGQFHGRITRYLTTHPIDKNAEYFLCGNGTMIEEVKEILAQNQIAAQQIHTEVFY